jgi:hypothetical protein
VVTVAVNLHHKIGTGLTPEQFISGMTQNQENFTDWYTRFEWTDPDDHAFFTHLAATKGDLRCLILAADWCGDVVRNVPVVFRVLATAQIPTEVLIMEENLDVMDQFLTLGGRSIPVVLFVDGAGEVIGRWGPRPRYVQEPMVAFKSKHPDHSSPNFEEDRRQTYAEIMRRYGDGTEYQKWIVKEIREILEGLSDAPSTV